jgi:hypothetical protein
MLDCEPGLGLLPGPVPRLCHRLLLLALAHWPWRLALALALSLGIVLHCPNGLGMRLCRRPCTIPCHRTHAHALADVLADPRGLGSGPKFWDCQLCALLSPAMH